MTHLREQVEFSEVRSVLVRDARALIPDLVVRMTTLIQQSVPSYAGPETGRRHRLIEMATSAAMSHFLDTVERPSAPSRSVDELFRRMGHGEATDEHDLEPMKAALRIVNYEAWELFRGYATERNWSAATLGWLADALLTFSEHLNEQAQLGYDAARRAIEQDPQRARRLLVDGLLGGADADALHPHAVTAQWPLPASFALVAISALGDEALPALDRLDDRYLVRADDTSTVIVVEPAGRTDLLERLARLAATGDGGHAFRAAVSWPVDRDQVPEAKRWVERALELARRGVIEAGPVIHCREHRAQLWLHAEPGLRQRMCQDLLRPLLAETPNSREILSETLLAWLESRDSAPAIAAKLNVHPQTVRYRWKRINELFGEDLREPEFVVQATMVLKASVPLWKAGDQSDFERFRTGDIE